MVRSAIFALSLAAIASPLLAQGTLAQRAPGLGGSLDAVFAPLPFQTWLSQSEQAHISWTARISHVQLTNYQRLSTRVEVEVDGPELFKRRGKGEFLILVQFGDEHDCVWQYHQSIDLTRVPASIKNSDALYSQSFFLLPGDYHVAIAIYDTATEEHSITKRRLHVAPLKNDPLPDAWAGLPAVELIGDDTAPNNWYLPFSSGVRLAVEPQRPIEVDLVVNLTPAEKLSGSSGAQNQNLSYVLPIFKVMAQTEWRNTELNVTMLDLAHHRVAFQQDNVRRLEWRRARRSLTEINPGVIDVEALSKRRDNANFFVGEILRRIAEPRVSTPRVVIVISSPMEFQSGEDLIPIGLAGRPDFKVYYFRYQQEPLPVFAGRPVGRRGWAPTKRLQRPTFVPEPDQLAPLLKPVDPHLYDVTTPEQVRKALAGMMAEIARM